MVFLKKKKSNKGNTKNVSIILEAFQLKGVNRRRDAKHIKLVESDWSKS